MVPLHHLPCLPLACRASRVINLSLPPLRRQHPDGGFGGGPFQLAHLAPTYAAVAALVTLGGEDALSGGSAVIAAVRLCA